MTALITLKNLHYYYQDGEHKRWCFKTSTRSLTQVFLYHFRAFWFRENNFTFAISGLDSPRAELLYQGEDIQRSGLKTPAQPCRDSVSKL